MSPLFVCWFCSLLVWGLGRPLPRNERAQPEKVQRCLRRPPVHPKAKSRGDDIWSERWRNARNVIYQDANGELDGSRWLQGKLSRVEFLRILRAALCSVPTNHRRAYLRLPIVLQIFQYVFIRQQTYRL